MNAFLKRSLLAAAALMTLLHGSPAFSKVELGSKFPDFSIVKLDGKGKLDSKSLAGKIVLVDFWAHWCEPCKISFPVIDKLAKKYKGKVVVVGINVDENTADAKAFLAKNPVKNITLLSDSKNEFVKKVGVAVMPSSFIVDKTGTVKMLHQGFHEGDEKEYEKELTKLLKGK